MDEARLQPGSNRPGSRHGYARSLQLLQNAAIRLWNRSLYDIGSGYDIHPDCRVAGTAFSRTCAPRDFRGMAHSPREAVC